MSNYLAQRGDIMTDQEFRLLSYYSSFPTSWTFRDTSIMCDLGWCQSKVKKTRLSLQKNGYLLLRRLPKNEFIYYIGSRAIKEYLIDKKHTDETSLTKEEQRLLYVVDDNDDMETSLGWLAYKKDANNV